MWIDQTDIMFGDIHHIYANTTIIAERCKHYGSMIKMEQPVFRIHIKPHRGSQLIGQRLDHTPELAWKKLVRAVLT